MLRSYEAKYVNGTLVWLSEAPTDDQAQVIVTFLPPESPRSRAVDGAKAEPELALPLADAKAVAAEDETNRFSWASAKDTEVRQLAETNVPPTALPIKLASGQLLRVLVVEDPQGRIGYVPYILSGEKAYIQLQRGRLPFSNIASQLADRLFEHNPCCDRLIAELILDDFSACRVHERTVNRTTLLLDLPSSFAEYRSAVISANLRRDLEREERRLTEHFKDYHFSVLEGPHITRKALAEAAAIVEQRLRDKAVLSGQDWESIFNDDWLSTSLAVYQTRGLIAAIKDGDRPIAVALFATCAEDCYYMAAGHVTDETIYSVGKLLLYRVIERWIQLGGKRLHLGGGNFGYKTRFGAKEVPLYVVELRRTPGKDSIEERIRRALQVGESMVDIDRQLARPVEEMLGTEAFEELTGVDFNTIEENAVLGTDGQCARYQSTLKEAFCTLMDHVPKSPEQTFVDVGSGKGKILYYAAQYAFRKYIGIEISERLVSISRNNFARLNLTFSYELLDRDVRLLDPAELSEADVAYLYNPFSAGILDDFLAKLVLSIRIRKRTIYLVYCNARYVETVLSHGFQVYKEFLTGQSNWRFDYSAIFRLV